MTVKRFVKLAACRAAAAIGRHRWPAPRGRLWIIMYHRVLPADDPRAALEEPGMMVTPTTFANHLKWIRRVMPIVRLTDWIAAARSGTPLPGRACAITFDDGWKDNYEFAFPLMADAGVSGTVFVVSHRIGKGNPFWPNRLAIVLDRVARDPRLAGALSRFREILPPSGLGSLTAEKRSAVIVAAKRLSDADIESRLDEVEAALRIEAPSDNGLMRWDDLREAVSAGVVDVGSHTCSHLRLNDSVTIEQIETEVHESRALIERSLGREVRLFCYPNGDVTPAAKEVVRRHYDAALTTERGTNVPGEADLIAMRRISVHDDVAQSESQLLARLSTWL